jgi:pimeloyl-ACP methyl ester carboxylesterase
LDELVSQGRFRAGDGTWLAWYEGGRADAPPMVFLSGLGGGVGIFRPLVLRFAPHYRLIGWDYRGLYGSGKPRRVALTMRQHVDDLLALLAHAGVEAPILVGWSMGVQLALELHRSQQQLPRAVIGIHGTSGRPFDTAFDSRWSRRLAPPVLSLLGRLERRIDRVGPLLATTPGVADAFVRLCRGLGVMSEHADVDAFRDVAEEWTRLDFSVYARIFSGLGEHDASDLLPKIATPALLVAGDRDPFTPAPLSRAMASVMSDADFALISGATHFGLLEQPEAIADEIEHFLRRRGLLALPEPPDPAHP